MDLGSNKMVLPALSGSRTKGSWLGGHLNNLRKGDGGVQQGSGLCSGWVLVMVGW